MIQALPPLFFLFKQPFARWPLRAHVRLAGALLVVAALVAWALLHQHNKTLRVSQSQLAVMQTQLRELQRTSKAIPVNFTQTLPSHSRIDDVVAYLNRQAQELGMQIASLSVTHQQASASELGRVRLTLSLNSEYRACKALLAALLDRYASLAVQSLSMHDMPNAPSRQETQLVLILFVKD